MESLRRGNGHPWYHLAVAAASALAILTGCGGGVEDFTGGGNTPGPVNTAPPTSTSQAVTILPAAATLFTGPGSPPLCSGGKQTFVVTGDAPPFTLLANGGCLSTQAVAGTGDSFTFTAGNTAGSYSVTATDALGRTATAIVNLRNANAALIKMDLVASQRSDNGDGTFTSVVGALLTDASGVVVSDDVPVEFTLVDPVAGVSLTSPGFTNQPPPCSADAVAQPGDALSCIKYVQSLQGATVTIHARAQVAGADGSDGVIIEDEHTVTLPDSRPPAPTPTPIPGQPAAIQFLGAQPAAIGVHGSGLPPQSVLTFQVTDGHGTPLSGVAVNFTLAETADESINPTQGLTDANGKVTVTITSGKQAGPVHITAQVDGLPEVITQSTAVAVFGAPPVQNKLSIAAERLNVAGRVLFGIQDKISIYANDRFSNAVPAGTAVTFTSNGASVVSQTATDGNGIATVQLQTERNIPPTGIVTVLAYTHGEETFQDVNGNGVYDPGTDILSGDDESEPFIDFRPLPVSLAPTPPNDADCPVPAPSWLCNNRYDAGLPFEQFVDANNNQVWDTQGTSGQWDSDILIFESIPVTFSGPLVTPVLSPQTFTILEGGAQTFTVEVHDDLVNPLVGGSTITVTSTSDKVKVTPALITIPDGESFNQIVDGLNRFQFVVSDAAIDMDPVATGASIVVTVTSQNGSGSFILASGVVDVPVPITPTPIPTPTPTTLPPALVPTQATLSAGTGAPPNNCNGSSQTFVVTGGSPPFAVFGGGGCVDVTSVPVSGGSFTYVAGNIIGDYAITVTDAIGRTASINVTVQGPPTPTSPPTPTIPPTLPPTPTPTAGTPAALRFVGADPSVIGVRGSGLPGQSTLTFQVTDALSAPLPGVTVSFSVVPLNDETITPDHAVTDSNGNVRVTLTSGERAISVQITAQVNSVSPPLVVRSTAVDILGAPPSQLHFSLAHQFHNISGRVTFGLTNEISAFVGDRFGNPVPPGTAVSFTTKGGVIGSPIFTSDLGQAVGTLVSQKPLPLGGIVNTLATTHGERPFDDANHNGICDPGETLQAVSEPYYDTNCNGVYDDGEDFIDLNNNHVFDADQGTGTPACGDSIVIFESICTTFSADTIVQLIPSPPGPVPAGGTRDYTLIISDEDGNPIVGGSTVNIAVQGRAKLLGPANFTIADAQTLGQIVDGINSFHFSITDNQPNAEDPETDALIVTVTSGPESLPAGGNGSVIVTDVITFLPVIPATPLPTATPTATVPGPPPTVTATVTATATPTPAAAHLHLSLFTLASPNRDGTMSAAISALITDANGVVVGDGAVVQFSIVGTPDLPAGVSVTSPGVTGGPPPCALCYEVPAQPGDALSCVKYDASLGDGEHSVTIKAVVDTPSGPLEDTEDIVLPLTTFVCPV